MNNLTVLENGLIPVMETDAKEKVVNARDLHGFLKVKKDFSTWIKDRISKYGFIENEDYIVFTDFGENLLGGRPKKEYIFKLDVAKEIAMAESNTQGRLVRRYFIEVEKKYKESNKPKCIEDVLIQSLQEMKAMRVQIEQAKKETAAVKQEIEDVRKVITINPKAEWRKETNSILAKVCRELSDFKKPKEEIYKALEERAKCKLKTRLNNLKARALENGMAPSKVKSLNNLDVIENDTRLKEIYITIVKEMAIKYKVA